VGSSLGARAVVIALVVAGAVLAGASLRQAREQAAAPADDVAEGAALAGSSASPSPNAGRCDALGRIAPTQVAPLAVADAGATKKVVSAEAGYEVVVPPEWRVAPGVLGQAAFGQAHISTYDPQAVPTPDPERFMLAPEFGISLDVQMWANPQREPLDQYTKRIHIGPDQASLDAGISLTIAGQAAYRFTIRDEHRFQPVGRPLVVTRQTRVVWLIQSPRPDRVIVAYATPGESALLGAVEQAVSSMRISAPALIQRPVVRQREEILRQWLYDKTGAPIAGRRAEAKLMTYGEAAGSFGAGPGGIGVPNGIFRIDHDPDDLYWMVAVSGPDLPQGRGGRQATPPSTMWLLYYTSATGEDRASTGAQYASQGTWPPSFDALPDRCH
jgi:hypothetical protein